MIGKVVVMIDGANTYAAFKQVNEKADFKRIRDYFSEMYRDSIVRFMYYTAILEEDDGTKPMQKLVDWLSYNGYVVKSKPAKTYRNGDGTQNIKGNMDVEIAVDIVMASRYADRIFVFSGDADFCSAIRAAQQNGTHVTVVSTLQTRHSKSQTCSDELRALADAFIDIENMKDWFIPDRDA